MLSYRDFLEAKNNDQILEQAMNDIGRIFTEIRGQMSQRPKEPGIISAEKERQAAAQNIQQQLAGKTDFNSLHAVVANFLKQHNISFPDAMDAVQNAKRFGSHLDRPLNLIPDDVWSKLLSHIQPMRAEAVENDFLAQKEAEVKQIVSNVYKKSMEQYRASDEETTFGAVKRALEARDLVLPANKRDKAKYNLIELATLMELKGFSVYFKSPSSQNRYQKLKLEPDGSNAKSLIPLLTANRFVQIRDENGKIIHKGLDIANETEVLEFKDSHL